MVGGTSLQVPFPLLAALELFGLDIFPEQNVQIGVGAKPAHTVS